MRNASIYRMNMDPALLALRDSHVVFFDDTRRHTEFYVTRANAEGQHLASERELGGFTPWAPVSLIDLACRINHHWELPIAVALPALDSTPPDLSQQVYFVTSRETARVKVGVTADFQRRIRGLRASSPEDLDMLEVVTGGPLTEAAYHALLQQSCHHNEWFRWSDDLWDLIARLAPSSQVTSRSPEGSATYDLFVGRRLRERAA